jgi:hypothetical protein
MDGDEQVPVGRVGLEPAPLAADRDRAPHQRVGGGGAHGHDQPRLHQLDLTEQPRLAGGDLARVRLLVDAPLATQGELEVLDRVGDVDLAALDAGLAQGPIEQLPGGADERPPLPVLLVARRLAHEHHGRGLRPLAEHGLRRVSPQGAVAAVQRLLLQVGQCCGGHGSSPGKDQGRQLPRVE